MPAAPVMLLGNTGQINTGNVEYRDGWKDAFSILIFHIFIILSVSVCQALSAFCAPHAHI
jgi:hypothetical protein